MTISHNLTALEICQSLVRCPSVTPDQAGALDFLENLLTDAGFRCSRQTFSADGTPDVENLYAEIGKGPPHLSFAGHVDVVPAGDEQLWSHPPFDAVIEDGKLYGRGTADMKGAVACFTAAALNHVAEGAFTEGTLSFIITCDEEGPAINGTRKLLDWMAAHGHRPNFCVLGEPSNDRRIGEAIKVGRRGSLNASLVVEGKQGHVAYQHLAENPVPAMLSVLSNLASWEIDQGTEYFAPSNLEISTIDVGNKAENVIPGLVSSKFNIRFNDRHSSDSLKNDIEKIVADTLTPFGLKYDLTFRVTGESFLCETNETVSRLADIIHKYTQTRPEYSTGGGTSDARFIKDLCPVVEFGLCNETIHQIDEHVQIQDLEVLTDIYRDFIAVYFSQASDG